MDGLGSSIEIDSKWTDVARILPRINEDVNEEWISDKSRYAFDGLKYQRLPYPMIKINNVLQECSWMDVMKFISQHVKGIPGYEIAGSIGPFQDVESLIAYRDFMHRLGSDDLEYIHKELAIDNTFRIQYLMNSRIRGVEDADVLLIIGTNLRNECPVLNSRIRKAVQKGLKVGIIGSAVNTFYEYTHLGNHPSSITQLLNSSNKFNQLLQNAKLPMVIMGSSVMERDDGKMIYNNVMKLVQECGIIKPKSKWNGFNVFQKYTSSAAALDIGITYKPRKTAPKVAYLLGSDDYESKDISSDTFVIYQGHTGDRGAARADVILPGCSYLEKNATYVNTEGRPQYGRKVGI
jgi:NADH dehydrogenase (ubiquinone) Fe-S protein 1